MCYILIFYLVFLFSCSIIGIEVQLIFNDRFGPVLKLGKPKVAVGRVGMAFLPTYSPISTVI